MKKIINGKLYDTTTAKSIGSDSYSNRREFNYWYEELYQKRTGEFFLYGEGGPMSRYARTIGQNEWSGGEEIMPLSYSKAREWAEKHLTVDECTEAFGVPDEDAEDAVLHAKIPAQIMAKLKTKSAESGESVTKIINDILQKNL